MKIEQYKLKANEALNGKSSAGSNIVLIFGSRERIENGELYKNFRQSFPKAEMIFCSTAGEIHDTEVSDDSLSVTAVEFEKTRIRTNQVNISGFKSSYDAGKHLIDALNEPDLRHIILLADGQKVNGSELVRGINDNLPKGVTVSGGLAGDGTNFKKTLVGINDKITEGNLVAIGLYGKNLVVGHGSKGGWDSFGPYRKITKSQSNVLYQLEGESALELYKQYLGDLAQGLPGSALLFPLSLKTEDNNESIVRTILSIDENTQSMTFAGDMPEGSYARLMKANFDRLIDAASDAASNSNINFYARQPELAILISCVGRKIVLDQRAYEEVECVRNVLGDKTYMTGFYSYGEISPLSQSAKSGLHNQTMTITTLAEA